jgi:hypothetical protein
MSDGDRERALEGVLFHLYERWWNELGYRAERFRQMIVPGCKRYKGARGAVRHVLTTRTLGFERLRPYPEMTVENLVASGEWDDVLGGPLWSKLAKSRLTEFSK